MSEFIHQITSGMAGWLTFEQMQGGVDNLREAELKTPIERIARGRGFEVKGEFPLPTLPNTRGAPQSIDFIMVHRKKKLVVALELKYKKTGKKMAGGVGSDAARLQDLDISTIDNQIAAKKAYPITDSVMEFTLVKAVLVAWHQSAIMEQIRLEKKPIRQQFIRLVKAMLPDGVDANAENYSKAMLGMIATKPVARKSGSLRAGSTVTHKRFWVASFLAQESWKQLLPPSSETGL